MIHQPFNEEYAWCGAEIAGSSGTGKRCRHCRRRVRSFRVAAFVEKWTRGGVEFTGKPDPSTWAAIFIGDSGSSTVYREPPGDRKVLWPTFWTFVGKVVLGFIAVVGTLVGIAVGIDTLIAN